MKPFTRGQDNKTLVLGRLKGLSISFCRCRNTVWNRPYCTGRQRNPECYCWASLGFGTRILEAGSFIRHWIYARAHDAGSPVNSAGQLYHSCCLATLHCSRLARDGILRLVRAACPKQTCLALPPHQVQTYITVFHHVLVPLTITKGPTMDICWSSDPKLFNENSLAIDRYFDERASRLFEVDGKSCEEIYAQPGSTESQPDGPNCHSPSGILFRSEYSEDVDCGFPSALTPPLDQMESSWGDLSHPDGVSGLILRKVSNATDLGQVANVWFLHSERDSCR